MSAPSLLAAAEAGCQRVVLAGSIEEPDCEDGEPVPVSPYAAAKFAANTYGRMFHSLHGLPVVTLRIFMVYGPAQPDESRLVPYVITSLQRGQSPELSAGRRPVDVCTSMTSSTLSSLQPRRRACSARPWTSGRAC